MKMFRQMQMSLAAVTLLVIGCGVAFEARAQRSWFVRLDLQDLVSRYSGAATTRDSLTNAGFFLRADYLERGGFTLGYNRTVLDFVDGTDVDQENYFLSGRIALTPDRVDGRITLRADAYDIANDAIDEADSVTAGTAQISFLNFDETFYWDLGFTRSQYQGGSGSGSSGRLTLDQLTPTIGFALNQKADWLQIRGYFVDVANGAAGKALDSTSAVELKWTHWLGPNGFLNLDNLRFGALAGERQFAVDHDAAAIFNLAELQTGTLSLGGEWVLGERNRVLLLAGVEEYETRDSFERYRGPFLYLSYAHEWQ